MAFKLKELEGELGEILNNLTCTKAWVLVDHEHHRFQIWSEPDFLYIHDLNINIFSAVSCLYYEDTEEYIEDCSLYLFYDTEGNQVYYEYGSSLWVCIHNYCHFVNIKINDLDNLLCCYILDNGKFLEEKVINKKNIDIQG